MMDISKSDWKLFRVKLTDWQEKYMERLIKEYVTALTDETRLASDKFWELEKRIKKDRQHPGVIMEMRKSDAIWNITSLIRLKVRLCPTEMLRVHMLAFILRKMD